MADTRHSIPTELILIVDEEEVYLNVPGIGQRSEIGYSQTVSIDLPYVLEGNEITLIVSKVEEVKTNNWYTGQDIVTPIALVELGIRELEAPPMPAILDSGCRDDLIQIDGNPIPIRIQGLTDDALNGRGLIGSLCGESVGLSEGQHLVETTDGRFTGFNIDRVVMVSAKGGEAVERWSETADPIEAKVEVISNGRTSLEAEISGQESPFWLVLGQSFNEGWVMTIDGRDMGSPELVDGFANGWFVDSLETGTLEVSFKWAPQKNIWVALSISLVGILICLCLVYRERRQKSLQLCLDTPTLHNPRASLHELSHKEALITSLLLGLFGAFVSNPLIGALVASLTWISARNFRRRILLTLLPMVGYCIGVAYIIFLQIKWEYEPAFSWPSWGRSVHHLGLLVVLLLIADVIVAQVSERSRRQKRKGEAL